jgi:peptidyl-prolyl cis-trans isomerase C
MDSHEPASAKPVTSLLRRWLREPLLHVLLIGATLFVVYYALNPGAGQRQDSNRIAITADDLAQIRLAWMAQWRRPPTPEELRNLLDGKIREEVLFREAMGLGLDKDDTIVKRRLAQKMEFVMEDASALREPADDELRRWFAQNAQRFAMPSLVTFRHLYFSPDLRGTRARDDSMEALRKLADKPEESPELEGLSDPFMFQDFYAERSPDQIAGIFGRSFAQALPGLLVHTQNAGIKYKKPILGIRTVTNVVEFNPRSGTCHQQQVRKGTRAYSWASAAGRVNELIE